MIKEGKMEKIKSFQVDHDLLEPGMYVSRQDGDITTFDLRTRKPNGGDYMSDLTMHSVEHMMASFLRNSEIAEHIIYFGPMGCQTGFYLLTRALPPERVLEEVKRCLEKTLSHEGGVFGAARKECGNYKNLSLEAAKEECRRYLDILNEKKVDFRYAE